MLKKILLGLVLALPIAFAQPAKALDVSLDGNVILNSGTATATAGAATLANKAGKVTSEALTTAAAAVYTLTITNSAVLAADICQASVAYGTASAGIPAISRVQPAAGSLVVTVQNIAAAAALNGTIVVAFTCFRA